VTEAGFVPVLDPAAWTSRHGTSLGRGVRFLYPGEPVSAPTCWSTRTTSVTLPRRDLLGDVPCVSVDAADVLRGERVEEVQPDEIQAWLRRDAAVVLRRLVLAENRDVDPAEILPEAGAPDHVRYLQDVSVLEDGPTVSYPHSLRHPFDARCQEVVRLHPDPRRPVREDVGTDLAAERRLHREHVRGDEPEDRQHEPRQ